MSWTIKADEVARMDTPIEELMESPMEKGLEQEESWGWTCWENGNEWVIAYGTGTMQTADDIIVLPGASEASAVELCTDLNRFGATPAK